MKFNAVIFDKDGLMLETEKLSLDKWLEIMTSRGYEVDKKMFLSLLGRNATDEEIILKNIFGSDFPFLELYNERKDRMEKHISRYGIPHKKGLLNLLDFLDENHIPKAVATSTSRTRGSKILRSANLLDRFDHIVYGDEVTHSKPEPDIFFEAARRIGVAPETCVVLEDSDAGIQAAHAAGMIPIMIPDLKPPEERTYQLLHKIFPSLDEVIPYLRSNLNGSR